MEREDDISGVKDDEIYGSFIQEVLSMQHQNLHTTNKSPVIREKRTTDPDGNVTILSEEKVGNSMIIYGRTKNEKYITFLVTYTDEDTITVRVLEKYYNIKKANSKEADKKKTDTNKKTNKKKSNNEETDVAKNDIVVTFRKNKQTNGWSGMKEVTLSNGTFVPISQVLVEVIPTLVRLLS